MRIYIESTIPSYLVARPARDLLQAARQQMTRDWWEFKRYNHELFTSQIVLEEISVGEKAMANLRSKTLAEIPVLDATDEVAELTRKILASGLAPKKAEADAAHIALATVHQMDILLTWNCRHIANVEIQARLRRLVKTDGHELPTICTMDEMIGETYEHND